MRRVRALLVALATAVAVAAGCGIPADDEPRAVSREQVPGDLEEPPEGQAEGRTVTATLYFTRYDGDRDNLAGVDRQVPASGADTSASPSTVLEALLDGPTSAEEADNLLTKIPADTALDGQPELDRSGTLTVRLNGAINRVQGDGARLAFGQMVCSVDPLPQVDSVLFAVEGQPFQAPNGDGETSSEPLTCDSYANLRESRGG